MKPEALTLQETRSIHDSKDIPKIEYFLNDFKTLFDSDLNLFKIVVPMTKVFPGL